jgi:hypothetical protein
MSITAPVHRTNHGRHFRSYGLRGLAKLIDLSLSETESGQQVKSNRAMRWVDERCLEPDLVGADRIVPVASVAASRDLDASSLTPAPQ